MYIYIDETSSNGLIGAGALLTIEPIQDSIINEAIAELDKFHKKHKYEDENVKRMDAQTLERGYFHASEDSKNSHSIICNCS